jgi:hypothetical protein
LTLELEGLGILNTPDTHGVDFDQLGRHRTGRDIVEEAISIGSARVLMKAKTETKRPWLVGFHPVRDACAYLTPEFSCKRVNKSAARSAAQSEDRLSAATFVIRQGRDRGA